VAVRLAGTVVADTTGAYRVLETSQAPAFYLPPADIAAGTLRPARGSSFCEWKGSAVYFDVVAADGTVAERAAWAYPSPTARFAAIADFVSFYPHLVECVVDDHRAEPMPGGFYGGWITPDVVGPFKGAPGTLGW
jgi:uncharacterized protein (DUF427 family)